MGGPTARRRPFVFVYSSLLNINVLRKQTKVAILVFRIHGLPGLLQSIFMPKKFVSGDCN